ncbi:MAG TPA: hypothetical protein VHA78_00490 [Candidatus Peribacteraceae bacterium]|nr:hypothetical protein [Candidatus Peribacteraceae bacterium]
MKLPQIIHRLSPRMQLLTSTGLLGLSALLLVAHAVDVRQTRDIGLPAAIQLSSIEQHISILKQQADAAQLTASISGGSSEELLHVYTLPADASLDRLVGTFTMLFNQLQKNNELQSVPSVQVGDTIDAPLRASGASLQKLQKTPVSFDAVTNEQGLKTLLLFSNVSGLLTVSDALSQKDIDTLIALTEQENPAAITSLEEFFATDLLQYAQDPGAFEDQLMRSFSSDSFAQSFHAVISASQLADVSQLLHGGIGQQLDSQKLWPLRFLTLSKSSVNDAGNGLYRVSLSFDAYSRAQ